MQIRLVLFTLLFAMVWQTAALARAGSTVNAMADAQHAALHWQDQSHHHDDDGSYHVDDSQESVQHVLSDHLSLTAALNSASAHALLASATLAPRGLLERLAPAPTLDGLLRPPRPRA